MPQILTVKVSEPPQRRASPVYLAGDENPKPVIDGVETPRAADQRPCGESRTTLIHCSRRRDLLPHAT